MILKIDFKIKDSISDCNRQAVAGEYGAWDSPDTRWSEPRIKALSWHPRWGSHEGLFATNASCLSTRWCLTKALVLWP